MRTYLIVSTALIAISTAYFVSLHRRLGGQVNHISSHGILRRSNVNGTNGGAVIESIPEDAFNGEHRMVIDSAWRAVPARSVLRSATAKPDKAGDGELDALMTRYLRTTMTAFTRLPQAPLIRLTIPDAEKNTFAADYISKLDFLPGQAVCGGYTVARRQPGKVEFAMKPVGTTQGRLVISIVRNATGVSQSDGDETDDMLVFRTDTIAWKRVDESGKIHLEVVPVKQIHEMTSWWLIGVGVEDLISSQNDVK